MKSRSLRRFGNRHALGHHNCDLGAAPMKTKDRSLLRFASRAKVALDLRRITRAMIKVGPKHDGSALFEFNAHEIS